MSELSCERMGAQIDEHVTGCASWVELGERLSVADQAHLSECAACRSRAVELVELERQLASLALEPLPQLDLTAGVLARLQTLEQPQRFPVLAWAPLLLVLACLLPDPDWLPTWLGWSVTLPEVSLGFSLPEIPLDPAAVDFVLALSSLALVATTWRWNQVARA